ncbi:MAG: MFS transporter [Ktedonobacteraceae bacterium]
MTPTKPGSPVRKMPLLINRNFALLWSGQAISILGDIVFDTTLVLWIANRIALNESWAPLAVSGVVFATSLPAFVLGPIAGVFVDRWDKRSTMLWTDALRALLIFLLMFISGLIPLPFVPPIQLSRLWQLDMIYTIVVLVTTCSQLFNPSRFVLIGDLVPELERPHASGFFHGTANLCLILGPPLAASLLFSMGVQWALAINACSFVASFLTLLAIHVPQSINPETSQPRRQIFHEFGAGMRFLATSNVLRTLLLVMCLVLLGGGISNTLEFFFVTQNLHATPTLYGFLSTASGIGLLLGTMLAGWGAKHIGGIARTFWLGVLVLGVMEILYARLTDYTLALIILFLQGIPNAALNVAYGPLIMSATPRPFLGRVSALLSPLTNLAALLSTVAAGYLVSTLLHNFHASILGIAIGPIDTLFTISGLLAVLGGIIAMLNLRSLKTGSRPFPLL